MKYMQTENAMHMFSHVLHFKALATFFITTNLPFEFRHFEV